MERWTPKIKKSLTEEGMELRMWTDKEGDYVLYKDYADLESRLAVAEQDMESYRACIRAEQKQRVEYAGQLAAAEKKIEELIGCWQPLADAINKYRMAVQPIVDLDRAFKGGHVSDFHIEQQTIDDIVASYDDLIAPRVFSYAPSYQDLIKQLAAAREGLEEIESMATIETVEIQKVAQQTLERVKGE